MNHNPVWYEFSPDFKIESVGFVQCCNYHPNRSGLPYWCLVLVAKGQRTLLVDSQKLRARSHEFFLLPPGTSHLPWEEDQHTAYFIHFYAKGTPVSIPENVQPSHIYLPALGRLPDDIDCFSLVNYMYNHILSPYSDYDFLAVQLHSLLLALSLQCQKQPAITEKKDLFMETCLSFIQAHACEQLSSKDYEAALALSYHQINQKFKAHFGVTVKQYHMKLRMKYAAQLLQSGLSIKQVSQQCGYEDYYFFISSFKQEYGITPNDYRHLHGF